MQLGEMQFDEMPHFFNTPHAFKKIGEMQLGEMPHTHFFNLFITIFHKFIIFRMECGGKFYIHHKDRKISWSYQR